MTIRAGDRGCLLRTGPPPPAKHHFRSSLPQLITPSSTAQSCQQLGRADSRIMACNLQAFVDTADWSSRPTRSQGKGSGGAGEGAYLRGGDAGDGGDEDGTSEHIGEEMEGEKWWRVKERGR